MKMIVLGAVAVLIAVPTPTAASDPTCSDLGFLDIEVHGQHVLRDYVTGGELGEEWPPQSMRDIADNRGAVLPGGPGAGYHLPNSIPPGASFCTDSQSWHAVDDD